MTTQTDPKHVQYTVSANGRKLRLELFDDATETERLFLDGISHFTATTMSRRDDKYLKYVSGIMFRLTKYLVFRKPEFK